MDSFTHKSPAKINTFLNVLSKRNDGYHNIYTHFELIDISLGPVGQSLEIINFLK